ncbi:MAG: hypothetical protein OEY14_06250 [Myxococcales bacterium]|nr:hypothetical protein [Myxococcales bacterium]
MISSHLARALRLSPIPITLGTLLAWALVPASAHAGIPECGGLRLEDVASCEVQASVDCEAGCSRFGIYKVACATQLQSVCRPSCTLAAEPTCTDSCTVMCQGECDLGVSITCQHNCFGECAGSCGTSCAGAVNVEQCVASCEATCDGECDIQCAVVDGDCYVHCVECCGGSCTAQANMDCQTSCQDVEFETCEREFQAECMASCSVDGALFCDGKYVMSATDIEPCIAALAAQGIMVQAEASVTLGPDGLSADGSVCSVSQVGAKSGTLGLLTLLGLGLLVALGRRRRR